MGNATRFLGTFIVTSSASTLTNALPRCDDAESIQLYISSGVSGGFFNPQFSGYDPIGTVGFSTNLTSSTFYSLQTILTTSAANIMAVLAGQTALIQNPGAFQMRLLGTGGETSGTVVGWAFKNIHV